MAQPASQLRPISIFSVLWRVYVCSALTHPCSGGTRRLPLHMRWAERMAVFKQVAHGAFVWLRFSKAFDHVRPSKAREVLRSTLMRLAKPCKAQHTLQNFWRLECWARRRRSGRRDALTPQVTKSLHVYPAPQSLLRIMAQRSRPRYSPSSHLAILRTASGASEPGQSSRRASPMEPARSRSCFVAQVKLLLVGFYQPGSSC